MIAGGGGGAAATSADPVGAAAAAAGSRNATRAFISGLSPGSLSRIVTFTMTVARVRSAAGMICRRMAL